MNVSLNKGLAFATFLAVGACASAQYFQPDNLMPSPRYKAITDIKFASTSIELWEIEMNWHDGRVNAPTGGSTIDAPYSNNEFGIVVFNGVFGQAFGGHDNGSVRIHDAGSGNYNLEFLQFNLSAGPYMFRESPTLASTGGTTMTPTTGGYTITSFFDVFVELSIDGGSTWIPGDHPVHMGGETPEPASMAILGLGAAGLALRRRKRK